jgi:hypothetical protein
MSVLADGFPLPPLSKRSPVTTLGDERVSAFTKSSRATAPTAPYFEEFMGLLPVRVGWSNADVSHRYSSSSTRWLLLRAAAFLVAISSRPCHASQQGFAWSTSPGVDENMVMTNKKCILNITISMILGKYIIYTVRNSLHGDCALTLCWVFKCLVFRSTGR